MNWGWHGSALVVTALLGGVWQPTYAQASPPFRSITIESHPKGWGAAHKTVEGNGTVTGAHMSGGPKAPRIFESKATMTPDDMRRLRALVAAVRKNPPKDGGGPPDQKIEGYRSVTIQFDGNDTVIAHATAREQHKFPHPDLQAIWDLIHKYNVGAW